MLLSRRVLLLENGGFATLLSIDRDGDASLFLRADVQRTPVKRVFNKGKKVGSKTNSEKKKKKKRKKRVSGDKVSFNFANLVLN